LAEQNKLRYLSTSVLFGWRPGNGRLDLFAGPEVSILVSGETEIQDNAGSRSFNIESDIRKDALGLLLGGSMNGPLGVSLHVTLNAGISDFSEAPGSFRNRSVTASISLPIARLGERQ
jgi:hypothetical protein